MKILILDYGDVLDFQFMNTNNMFALVDGNNFYVSCEKAFDFSLEGKPVVVLSNNDGCIISRSNEAKALGLKMAEPIFKRKDIIEKHNVQVFSSNYTHYGNMSNRMMKTLQMFSPDIEVYSIDEAFLNLNGINVDYNDYAFQIKNTIFEYIGIPVGVGIADTKTLAKIANKLAKKQNGVLVIDSEEMREWALKNTPIGDVWGIGRQYAKMLKLNSVNTAYDFTQLTSSWVKSKMSIVGQRTRDELLGKPCISIDTNAHSKKNIATTRAFGIKLSDINIISEAVANHAVRCAEKLRKQKSVANCITVFIHSDPFSEKEKYVYNSTTITLTLPSNNNTNLVKAAIYGLKKIYRPNVLYKKTGVIVSDISSDEFIQGNLFIKIKNLEKNKTIIKYLDELNIKFGKDTVKLAIQGNSKNWKLKQEKLSPRYTTRWADLLKVKT